MKIKHAELLIAAFSLLSLSITAKHTNNTEHTNNTKHTSNTQQIAPKLDKIHEQNTSISQFSIKIEPRWDDLDKNSKNSQSASAANNRTEIFKDRWILAADIIIKKATQEYVSLHELHLCWHGKNGEKINKLVASLYEKNSDKNFMPIEQYLICDSTWKKSEQKLILKFDKPKTLFAINKLSLVLTIPNELISTLKNGHFTLDSECLPTLYKEYTGDKGLCLYLCQK